MPAVADAPTDASPPPKRRGGKYDRDPRDQYIRRVKGGKFQVRPYCSIVRERYCLSELFDSIVDARRARDAFWRGQRPDCERFTKRINTKQGPQYLALVYWRGRRYQAGPFETREQATCAVRGILAVVSVSPTPPPRT